MVVTKLENLSNELLLIIGEYLSTVDRCYSFFNLNIRLNHLLGNDLKRIDLSNCRRSRFVLICETLLNEIENPFSLKLSLKRLNGTIDALFVQLKHHLLESLTLIDVDDQSIDQIIKYLNRLSNLRSLTIVYHSFASSSNALEKIMDMKMGSLISLQIDSNENSLGYRYGENPGGNCSRIMNIKKLDLSISISLSVFRNLLHLLPEIVSIDIILMGEHQNRLMDKPSIEKCSPNLEKLKIRMDHKGSIIRFEAISKLLKELPQLRQFWYSANICDNSYGIEYHDGQVWEDLIRRYLTNLIDFRLNIGMERSLGKYFSENIIQSFSSPFWIEEKKWYFVADQVDNNSDTIELYSLPPPSRSKVIFSPSPRWASNIPNPNFQSVTTIGFQSSSEHYSSSYINKSRYFPKVRTIEPPHDVCFDDWNIISNLSNVINLTSLTKLVIANSIFIPILPAMTNLTTLNIQRSDQLIQNLKKISSPLFQLKRFLLKENFCPHYFDREELTIIENIFPNLGYLQLSLKDLQDLTILINQFPYLIFMTIFYEPEQVDANDQQQWIETYHNIYKFNWSLRHPKMDQFYSSDEQNQLEIWLD